MLGWHRTSLRWVFHFRVVYWHLQAAVFIPNLAPIATSHSSAKKMEKTQLRKTPQKTPFKVAHIHTTTQKERERERERSIRARTNGPEDRVSPIWVETHTSEGLMKGHHPNSFFASICCCCCSWAHHLSLSFSLTIHLFLFHTTPTPCFTSQYNKHPFSTSTFSI